MFGRFRYTFPKVGTKWSQKTLVDIALKNDSTLSRIPSPTSPTLSALYCRHARIHLCHVEGSVPYQSCTCPSAAAGQLPGRTAKNKNRRRDAGDLTSVSWLGMVPRAPTHAPVANCRKETAESPAMRHSGLLNPNENLCTNPACHTEQASHAMATRLLRAMTAPKFLTSYLFISTA